MRKYHLYLIAFACIVVGLELAARHEGFGSPMLYRAAASGYEIVPGQRVVRLGETTTINAAGMRGGEIAPIPAPGVWRIIALGDSVTNGGTRLDDAQTYPAVASRLLARAGCANEILNASAGGWSLFDEVAWTRQHGLFGARTMLWTINFMDLDQPPSSAAILDHNPAFPTHRPMTGLGEIVLRYILPRLGLAPGTADNGSVMGEDFDARQFQAVRALVRDEKADLDRKGVSLTVIFHDGATPMPAARQSAEQTLLADLVRLHVPVLRTPLSTLPDHAGVFLDEIHPNARGDALIGRTIASALQGQCPATAHVL